MPQSRAIRHISPSGSSPTVSSRASSPETLEAPVVPKPVTAESSEAPKNKKLKAAVQEPDWSDVTDPEERRRIQNRIAQRKFREKTKENKERAEREARNNEHAANSYRIPTADDFTPETELSGLPWGGLNFGHSVSKGHETESRRSSGRGTYMGDEGYQSTPVFVVPSTQRFEPDPSFGSSGPDDTYLPGPTYGYSPGFGGLGGFPPM